MGETLQNKWTKRLILIFLGVVFLFYFLYANPLVMYDGDDWVNIGRFRTPLPSLGTYNPIKVLPETLYPFVGDVAAYFATPLTGDYIFSVSVCSAVVLSLFLLAYVILFSKVLRTYFNASLFQEVIFGLLFVLFHFLILKKGTTFSSSLFSAANLTCIYHYVIPAILNFSVCFYLLCQRKVPSHNKIAISLLILFIYLSIFSNILQSIVLAAFIGAVVLDKVDFSSLRKGSIKSELLKCKYEAVILAVWLLSLLFESHGNRAKDIATKNFGASLSSSAEILIKDFSQLKPLYICLFALAVLIFLFFLYARKRSSGNYEKSLNENYFYLMKISFLSFIVVGIYLVLVCAVAGPGYMGRSDVLISLLTWTIMMVVFSLLYMVRRYDRLTLFLPLLLLFIVVPVFKGPSVFSYSTVGNVPPVICYKVDQYLIQQIQEADREGLETMQLKVPKGDNRDNWPHPMYMGRNISRTLYRHGLISRPIKIEIVPAPEVNQRFNLAVPK